MATTGSRPRPQAGKDYPKNYADFLGWFPDDAACIDYLDWLRWPDGFSCPDCSGGTGWRMSDGRWWCKECRRRISATAGTIFHRTKTPLTVWFAAAWHMTAAKNGVSAKTLHRLMGFGSYETAWAMLHRFRGAIGHAERTRLSGDVEVDETVLGGARPGKRGRGAAGKVLIAVAVEQIQPKGFGRCRMHVIPNAEADTLRAFLLAHVEPGSKILTDGWTAYPLAAGDDYVHRSTSIKGSGMDAHEVLPGVHRVAALAKRWLLGTHQGSFSADHLQAYLDEFAFRFNRRGSRARGMLFYRLLEQSVAMHPISFQDLVANPSPRKAGEDHPAPPSSAKGAPSSLYLEIPRSPWRL
jgi:transposase-like protein